jgi:hypothetical protein
VRRCAKRSASADAAIVRASTDVLVNNAGTSRPRGIRVNGVAPGHVPGPTLDRIHSGDLPPVWPQSSSRTGLMAR